MDREHLELLTCSAEQLIAELEVLRGSGKPGLLAFDGDGTLWSGDVGEDVFHYAVARELILDAARPRLLAEAGSFAIDPGGTPTALAYRLFCAYRNGNYPERSVCAMMTWCYAGRTRWELARIVTAALQAARLSERVNQELKPIFDFAREVSLRVVVVSASPQPIVERAAERWNIPPRDVIASTPAIEHDRLLPDLAAPVPYAEAKVSALSSLLEEHVLLASFGDNVFDLELLCAAQLGVAVQPKPALRHRLPELKTIRVLKSD